MAEKAFGKAIIQKKKNPKKLNKEEKKSIEKFRDSENFTPSEGIKEKIFRRFKNFFE